MGDKIAHARKVLEDLVGWTLRGGAGQNSRHQISRPRQLKGSLCPAGTAENSPAFSTLGGAFRNALVPKGRLNEGHVLRELIGLIFSRPFGTWPIRTLFPTLKRWAI